MKVLVVVKADSKELYDEAVRNMKEGRVVDMKDVCIFSIGLRLSDCISISPGHHVGAYVDGKFFDGLTKEDYETALTNLMVANNELKTADIAYCHMPFNVTINELRYCREA